MLEFQSKACTDPKLMPTIGQVSLSNIHHTLQIAPCQGSHRRRFGIHELDELCLIEGPRYRRKNFELPKTNNGCHGSEECPTDDDFIATCG